MTENIFKTRHTFDHIINVYILFILLLTIYGFTIPIGLYFTFDISLSFMLCFYITNIILFIIGVYLKNQMFIISVVAFIKYFQLQQMLQLKSYLIFFMSITRK